MSIHPSSLWFVSLVIVVMGCSESTGPTALNLGVPPNAKEGEFSFYINGRHYDHHSALPNNDGSASIRPLVIQGSNAVSLSISMFYDFGDGSYGTVGFDIPLLAPTPQRFQLSDVSSLWNPTAIGSCSDDSDGYTSYRSIPGGTLVITKLDTVANLVSGYFEMMGYESYPSTDLHKTISVTNGYFNDIPIGEGSYGQGSITALLNGSPYISDTGGREMVYADSEFNRIDLFDYGQGHGTNSYISIQNIPTQTGTYQVDSSTQRDGNMPYMFFENLSNHQQDFSTHNAGSSGTLTITNCDIAHRRISGTFQFSGPDSTGSIRSITSGLINNVRWVP